MALKDNTIIYLSRKVWKYSEGNRGKLIFYVLLFIIANAISFLQPLLVGYILNTIQSQGVTAESLPIIMWSLAGLIGLTIGTWIFHGPGRILERENAFIVKANYKKYLVEGVMNLRAQWHSDHHSGDTIDKIEKGTTALYNYSSISFEVIESVMRFLGSYIALVYFNFASTYIVLLIVIITFFVIIQFDKVLVRQYRIIFRQENETSAKIFDFISNITTIIILRVQKIVSSNVYKKIMEPFGIYKKNNRLNEVKWFIVSILGSIMMFLVLATYIYSNYKMGVALMVGTLYILYGYVERINILFFRFAFRYGEMVRQKTAVMNSEELTENFESDFKKTSKIPYENWHAIKVKNLNFSYHQKRETKQHLENISLTIKRGQRIAFIGESGSGKTTMLKVMIDLYTPENIELSIDGKKLVGFNEISRDITLLPQDPELFTTTIEENITMGGTYDFKTIEKYVKAACFTDVVERLPKKYQSSIKERGVNLSGGEKQRLALARGLLACEDKQIILLDEPTSSVDSKNELLIYKNIFKDFKRKTIISSIHRLHLLPLFDKIYYFENGKIIASGNFKELLKTSPEFKKTWKKYNSVKKK